MKGKTYDSVYRQEPLGLVDAGRKASEVSREYGVPVAVIPPTKK